MHISKVRPCELVTCGFCCVLGTAAWDYALSGQHLTAAMVAYCAAAQQHEMLEANPPYACQHCFPLRYRLRHCFYYY